MAGVRIDAQTAAGNGGVEAFGAVDGDETVELTPQDQRGQGQTAQLAGAVDALGPQALSWRCGCRDGG